MFAISTLYRVIGVLFYGTLATYGFTVSALLAVQAEEIQWFDFTATGALASFCRGGFKGHAGCFTHSTPSNQNVALSFFTGVLPLPSYWGGTKRGVAVFS